MSAVLYISPRQRISDELDDLDRLEELFGWSFDCEQDRRMLRLELAALDKDERAVSRAMQGAKL